MIPRSSPSASYPQEDDAGTDLAVELVGRHVWLAPAVGGDDAPVGLGGGVDNREDRRALVVAAGPDGRHGANLDFAR
jgi:hypothetical protein